jgi:hypothetical protein
MQAYYRAATQICYNVDLDHTDNDPQHLYDLCTGHLSAHQKCRR